MRQRVIAAHHLESMEPNELEPYIKHRLECVGWDGNPEFDQRVFKELYDATDGIPRRVNQVVTRLLLLGAVEQRTRIDNAMLTAVLKEMQGDNAFPEAAPKPMDKVETAPTPGPIKHVAAAQAVLQRPAQERLDTALAERDAQIKELQQAIVELSRTVDTKPGNVELPTEVSEKIAGMQARLDEQERTVRHVLTMMIEWIESEQPPRVEAA